MNKLLLLGMIGGAVYLMKSRKQQPRYAPARQSSIDYQNATTEQERLDEGLDESFPASDPPSLSVPTR